MDRAVLGEARGAAGGAAIRGVTEGTPEGRQKRGTTLASNVKRDYYEVLGVARGANDQEIKSAYRKLALQFHPDRNPNNPGAEDKFKECSEAYAILADGDKRAAYDRFGHAGVSGAGASGG